MTTGIPSHSSLRRPCVSDESNDFLRADLSSHISWGVAERGVPSSRLSRAASFSASSLPCHPALPWSSWLQAASGRGVPVQVPGWGFSADGAVPPEQGPEEGSARTLRFGFPKRDRSKSSQTRGRKHCEHLQARSLGEVSCLPPPSPA